MGLCRCPKRKVTTQFCYEHRVNVCETCMVQDHPNCIVQGYLQWLKDSDYEPVCALCRKELVTGDCIRLLCYHVFHWQCLNEHCSQLPSTTAPAGYTCPTCGHEVIPKENVVSPVADVIRRKLDSAAWALPPHRRHQGSRSLNAAVDSNWSAPSPTPNGHASFRDNSANSTAARKFSEAPTMQKSFVTTPLLNEDEDKYKRKSVLELANRWFQSKALLGTRRREPSRRWAALIVAGVALILVIIYFMARVGRGSIEGDPFLDPNSNPDIHIQQ